MIKFSKIISDETKPYLIVTSQNELVKGDPSLQHYVAMPIPGVRSMTGLDVHIAEDMVYFSDSAQKKIYRVQTDGSNLTEVSICFLVPCCDFRIKICSVVITTYHRVC